MMEQPTRTEYSGQFQSGGDQWIGSTINTGGGNVSFHNGMTINAKVAARTDYTGHYAHNALLPVATYTERKTLNRKIEAQLHDQVKVQNTRIQIVHGIGGAGKTQLVMNYVTQYRKDYSAVFWIEARTKESLERDYLQIYLLLYDIHRNISQEFIRLEDAVPAVKRWFYRRDKRWLFVFDSADNISRKEDQSYIDLRYYLPDDPSVHIIVTTRDGAAMKMSNLDPVEVAKMEEDEAMTLFKKHMKMETTTSLQEKEIRSIVQELGCLALAIILAGSYVSATPRLRADITKYLPEYRVRRRELLDRKPDSIIDQYGESVLATWETSFHAMRDQCPEACQFLGLLAFLHGDDIFIDFGGLIESEGDPTWTRAISSQPVDRYKFDDIFSVLQRHSFVSFRDEQRSYTMHKLVQIWAYDRLAANEQQLVEKSAALLMDEIIYSMQDDTPVRKGRLVPHLMTSFEKLRMSSQPLDSQNLEILNYCKDVSYFLDSCGRWRDVCTVERIILLRCREIYDAEHPNTIEAMGNLAITLRSLGQFKEAQSIELKVLELRTRILGEEHPDTITAQQNVAITLRRMGKVQEALSIQRKLVGLRTRLLGEEHPSTVIALNNLAVTLGETKDLSEARSIQRRVLAIRTRLVGEEHPETITALGNLAVTLHYEGDYQKALSTQRKVLEVRSRILGEEHLDTITTMKNLVMTLRSMKQWQEALAIQRIIVTKREELLGKEHPKTISAKANLALLLEKSIGRQIQNSKRFSKTSEELKYSDGQSQNSEHFSKPSERPKHRFLSKLLRRSRD